MTGITQAEMIEIGQGCHAYRPDFSTGYGYIPSKAAGVTFCVLFGLSMALHIAQFCWKRTWWCSVFAIGCLIELIGWAGRTWSSECPYNSTAFMIQISTLIIAPTMFTAGIYILLGRFIQIAGPESSIFTPKQYLWIFCTCDVVSLVIQAVGGGLASSESGVSGGDTAPGTQTMVAGIVFQLVSISIFVVCTIDFVRRVTKLGLLRSAKGSFLILMATMVMSVLCIYIRSIYRTIELAQGWDGYLITHESYFIGLDGVLMVIAVGIFNVFHPGWLLSSVEGLALPASRASGYKAMEISK